MDYQELAKQFVANADPICFILAFIFVVYLFFKFVVKHVWKATVLVFIAYCIYQFFVTHLP